MNNSSLKTFGYSSHARLSILFVIQVTQLKDYIQRTTLRHWLCLDVDIYVWQRGSGSSLGDVQTNVNILPVDSDTPLRNLFKVAHDILN